MISKSVTESALSKALGLSYKQHRQSTGFCGFTAGNTSNFMNRLRTALRLIRSSEIQLFQTVCVKIT